MTDDARVELRVLIPKGLKEAFDAECAARDWSKNRLAEVILSRVVWGRAQPPDVDGEPDSRSRSERIKAIRAQQSKCPHEERTPYGVCRACGHWAGATEYSGFGEPAHRRNMG